MREQGKDGRVVLYTVVPGISLNFPKVPPYSGIIQV
jgi:hypothetical protein